MHMFKLNNLKHLKLALMFPHISDTGYLLESNGKNSEKLVDLST